MSRLPNAFAAKSDESAIPLLVVPQQTSKRAKGTLAGCFFSLLTSLDSFFVDPEEALCAVPTEKSLDRSSSVSFFSRVPIFISRALPHHRSLDTWGGSKNREKGSIQRKIVTWHGTRQRESNNE